MNETDSKLGRLQLLLVASLFALSGCEGAKRDYADPNEPAVFAADETRVSELTPSDSASPSTNGGGSPAETSETPEDVSLLPIGQTGENSGTSSAGVACQDDSTCNGQPCVDGYCCDVACGGTCEACNAPGFEGTCSPAASDVSCPELRCPADTECLGYDNAQASNNCAGFGQCLTEVTCAEVPKTAGTTCGANSDGTCDGAGVCTVPNKSSLGEGCGVDGDCAEGHCVVGADGANICCDTACDGLCEQCSNAGRCDSAPATDDRCGEVDCPVDNVCRDYPESLAAGECTGLGLCREASACLSDYEALRPDAQCDCDSLGACTLRVSVGCGQDSDCGGAGACEATSNSTTICCASSCGAGLFCSADGASCVQCEGGDISCQGNNEQRCENGSIATRVCANGCTEGVGCNANAPVGFSCAQSVCEAGAVCQNDTSGQRRCCTRDCSAEGRVCSTDGSCECAPGQVAAGASCLLVNGDPCQTNGQCQGNLCVDGVCCAEACDGFCEQCQPFSGQCVAVGRGQQDDSCNNTHECTGQLNDCRARVGELCPENNNDGCITNRCSGTAGGGAFVCCAQNCGGQAPFCSSDGQDCVQCESNLHCGFGAQCSFLGTCECPSGLVRQPDGSCTSVTQDDGAECNSFTECQSQQCVAHYVDEDGDGFAASGAVEQRFCASSGFTVNGFTRTTPADAGSSDCLDSDRNVRPNQNVFFPQPRSDGSFDYNCDGVPEKDAQTVITDDICFENLGGACDAEGILGDSECGEIMISGFCVRMGPSTCSLGRSGNAIGPRGCR